MDCPDKAALVEARLDRVLTHYRESPKLLGLIRNYLTATVSVLDALCPIQDVFDIETAVGDQLTIVGKWLGWPRCHCAGRRKRAFGFQCEPLHQFVLAVSLGEEEAGTEDVTLVDEEGNALGDWAGTPLCEIADTPVGGFCEPGVYFECGGPEFEEFCFEDDDLYRAFLKARIFQLLNDYRRETVNAALRGLFGEDARIMHERPGVIIASAGRPLTETEKATLHLFRQVLPVAPGVRIEINGQLLDMPFFGFGEGWGGLCESVWLQ